MHTLSGPVAIEVELQAKTASRLRGICWMYAQLSEDDAPLDGVIYITNSDDVARLIMRNAAYIGLESLSLRTLDEVFEQTQSASVRPVARLASGHRRVQLPKQTLVEAQHRRPIGG